MPQTPNTDLNNPNTIEQLIERSAKRGARIALNELGLDDHSARQDIHDLRHLLTNWRSLRRQMLEIGLRLGVHLLFIALAAIATLLLWAGTR